MKTIWDKIPKKEFKQEQVPTKSSLGWLFMIWGPLLMALIFAFTSTYDTATPTGQDDPREADDRMREIKEATRERLDVEHYFPLTGTEVSDANVGKHKDITADSIKTKSPWLDVTHADFGALGNNGNDTTAIQTVFAAAEDGDTIFFPASSGAYVFDSIEITKKLTITCAKGVEIKSQGNNTYMFLLSSDDIIIENFIVSIDHPLNFIRNTAAARDNITIRNIDLTLDAAAEGQHAILFTNDTLVATNLRFQDCSFFATDTAQDAIHVAMGNSTTGGNIRVEDCHFDGWRTSFYSQGTGTGKGFWFLNNTVLNSYTIDGRGLRNYHLRYSIIEGNYFDNIDKDMYIWSPTSFSYNTVVDSVQGAVLIEQLQGACIGNRILDAGGYGLFIDWGSTRGVITNNTIQRAGTYGIHVAAAGSADQITDLLIADNVIQRSALDGIFIDDSDNPGNVKEISIKGNDIIGDNGASDAAIRIEPSSGTLLQLIIKGNKMVDSGRGVYVEDGNFNDLKITDNDISAATPVRTNGGGDETVVCFNELSNAEGLSITGGNIEVARYNYDRTTQTVIVNSL